MPQPHRYPEVAGIPLQPALRASIGTVRSAQEDPPLAISATQRFFVALGPPDDRERDRRTARVAFSQSPHPLAAFYTETRSARPSPISSGATPLLAGLRRIVLGARSSRIGQHVKLTNTSVSFTYVLSLRCPVQTHERSVRSDPPRAGLSL